MYVLRIQVPGSHCHLGTRGNNKRDVFLDDADRQRFLALLERIARRHGWIVLAYCLMSNHYHLVIQLGEAGMARGMCELNGGYATIYNVKHGRINHLFGSGYWDRQLDSVERLLDVSIYVVLNPVRAGLVRDPGDWPWSSYNATAGFKLAPAFLATGALLRHFGNTPASARENYIAAVREWMLHPEPVPRGHGRRQPPV